MCLALGRCLYGPNPEEEALDLGSLYCAPPNTIWVPRNKAV